MKEKEIVELIRRVQRSGDRDAADRLVRFFYRDIFSFVYRQTAHQELSQDLTQEIFISVLRSLSNYDPGKASFRTWLYRIAANKLTDFFRSAYHRRAQLQVDIDSVTFLVGDSMDEIIQEKELKRQAVEALNSLPFSQQQILRLKFFGNATFDEIASALSLPLGTVKTNYYSALKKLRGKVGL